MNRLRMLPDEGELSAARLRLSRHARDRAHELGATGRDIALCVTRSEQSYPQHPRYAGAEGGSRRVYQRDGLAVVVDESNRVVVTVLLRRQQQWVHGVDRYACT